MKCICGFDDEVPENIRPDSKHLWGSDKLVKSFVEIKGMFMIDVKHSYTMNEKRAYLYACPVCKTVQMET